MGTSKGYIPPKSNTWRLAKGAVTRMTTGNYSKDNIKTAISKFAEAYKSTHLGNSNISLVTGGVINFINSINTIGAKETAEKLGIDSLLNKTGNDLYKGILDYFARDISTIDSQVIRDTLADTFEQLGINTFDDFGNITSEEFLITFIINFAIKNFEVCFSEKILSNLENVEVYDRIIDDVRKIIENKIVTGITINKTLRIDFLSEQGQAYIKDICKSCFDTLTIMEEAYEDMD